MDTRTADDGGKNRTLQDQLLAALLHDSSSPALSEKSERFARVWLDAETEIAVFSCPESDPSLVRSQIDALVREKKHGTMHVVAIGGGKEVKRQLAKSNPFWQVGRRLSFHHLTADGNLKRVAGPRVPALRRAAENMPLSAQLTDARIRLLLDTGRKRFSEDARLVSALRGRTPWFSIGVVLACTALFVLGKIWGDNIGQLLLMGANLGTSVRAGEVWRLFASTFLHGNAEHLIVNMVALLVLGPFLEALLGRPRFILLYGLSALGGAIASALFLKANMLSVGASGAIWGLMTAGIGLVLRPRDLLPPLRLKQMRKRVIWPVLLNVGYSFLPGIDLYAHFGGGVTGLLLALVLTHGLKPIWNEETPTERTSTNPLLLFASVVVVVAMLASVGIAMSKGQPWTGKGQQITSSGLGGETIALGGGGTLYFDGGVTRQEAEKFKEFLNGMTMSHITAKLSREGEKYVFTIAGVKNGLWDKPDRIEKFQSVAQLVSALYDSKPVDMVLLDDHMKERRRIPFAVASMSSSSSEPEKSNYPLTVAGAVNVQELIRASLVKKYMPQLKELLESNKQPSKKCKKGDGLGEVRTVAVRFVADPLSVAIDVSGADRKTLESCLKHKGWLVSTAENSTTLKLGGKEERTLSIYWHENDAFLLEIAKDKAGENRPVVDVEALKTLAPKLQPGGSNNAILDDFIGTADHQATIWVALTDTKKRGGYGRVVVSEALDLDFHFRVENAQEAIAFARAVGMLRKQFTAQIPPTLAETVERIAVTPQGSEVVFKLTLSEEQLTKLVKILGEDPALQKLQGEP